MNETEKTFPRLLVLSAFLAAGMFVVDLLIPLGIAAGVPYVALVLVSLWSHQKKHTIIAAIAGTVLTIIGFFLSPFGGIPWMVLVNRFLALFAIWVTAVLSLQRKRVEEALRKGQEELRKHRDHLDETVKIRTAKLTRLNEELQYEIEEHEQAKEALQESEKRYRLLTENVADGVGIVQDRKFQFVNAAFADISGYAVEQLVEMEPIGLFRDDHKERFKKLAEKLEKGIPVECFQAPLIRRDRREIWIEGRHNIIEWEGKPAALVTIRDVTEGKLREMAMEGEREHLQRENKKLKASLKDRYQFGKIVGKSHAIQRVYELILKSSTSGASVLIYGESGTGKDLIAQTIHEMSDRCHKAFVAVNCGAIPETLLESEFFGHRKGAFTGAHVDKQGFFDFAHEGTLFLDEVGELTLNMQVKLLRAIDGAGYTPVGDNKTRNADIRIIVATNKSLTDMVNNGSMRKDFFYRIDIIPITVPPLRDRKEDIPLLIEHFLQSKGNGKKVPTISGKTIDALCNYDWPGNVRELQNVLQRYLVLKNPNLLKPAVFNNVEQEELSGLESNADNPKLHATVECFEKTLVTDALNSKGWNRSETAASLGISRKTLFRKMKYFGLGMTQNG